jgi:hypothetical protein
MRTNAYGETSEPPVVGRYGCLPPTLGRQAADVALPIVAFPMGMFAGIIAQPLLALPTAGAIVGLYLLGKAYGKEQRKGRR